MSTLVSEIHFWSTQEDVIVKLTDYGSYKYYSKKDINDSLLYQSKKKYCEQRGVLWNLPNKRPQKLRDRLKELEDYLLHNKVVCFSWSDNQLQLLLSTGVLVNLTIDLQTGDVSSINFDRQLSAKLQVNILCDGIILKGSQIICICNDGHVLGYGGSWKEAWIVEGGPRRHLNYHNDWLAVWGKSEAEHPQPWSPLGKDYQRANLHLYWIGSRGAELLAYKKTDGDPLDVVVSRVSSKTILIIEQKVTLRGSVSVEVSSLELFGNNLKRISVTSVPLQTQVCCCGLSKREDRLIIGCIDGSIALLDRNRGSTRTIKALFIPKYVRWHQEGAVVAILNERGQLQYFDTALNSVKSQVISEDRTPTSLIDISGYFNVQFTISSLSWGPKDLILVLEQGPIVLLSHVDGSLKLKNVAQHYLKMGKVAKAIRLLLSHDLSDETYLILQKIVGYLLCRSLTEEIAKYLQDALGSYHSPPTPLSTEIRAKYGTRVCSMTRRFFHQLVRHEMFETAFLLAVDLGHHDLFMDLHYIAVTIGETEMAAAARAQASALLSRCSSEASNCSRSSCSQCSDSEDSGTDPRLKSKFDSQNLLSTNFNQPAPMTYNTYSSGSVLNYTPRATFVKAPQIPASFRMNLPGASNNGGFTPTPPLPNLNRLGIPLVGAPIIGVPQSSNFKFSMSPSVKLPTSNPFSQITQPPPVTMGASTGAIRKPQAKVKFSDTVTAFIVPEIKRPVRPPPPPHLTDPQKELADSLPLCHPNEDYLKDFTPVKRGDGAPSNNNSNTGEPPKIKVVHFGVV